VGEAGFEIYFLRTEDQENQASAHHERLDGDRYLQVSRRRYRSFGVAPKTASRRVSSRRLRQVKDDLVFDAGILADFVGVAGFMSQGK
jgi:hypothetical protein